MRAWKLDLINGNGSAVTSCGGGWKESNLSCAETLNITAGGCRLVQNPALRGTMVQGLGHQPVTPEIWAPSPAPPQTSCLTLESEGDKISGSWAPKGL